ncbi:hypothetical protein SAMD00019534_087640, partial [Acytostelium subglobosum LB1]|uniref:hypothetical protein n=1 Tax=Acytostelium subglobosum LB1 TaxID=1410327 RepID=UPI000644C764
LEMTDFKHLIDRNDRLILPDYVVPLKYQLHIIPDMIAFKFEGTVSIEMRVVRPTTEIVLHSFELSIKSAQLSTGAQSTDISYHEPEEVAILKFSDAIAVGTVTLTMQFEGCVNDKLMGFYRSRYTIQGVDHHMAVSQFEATYARRCFPCFDEPALKAVYDITLTVPSHMTALSNMAEISSKDNGNGTKTVHFADTPLMSTYLVAFIVGELEYIEGHSKEGVQVRVYKVKGNTESTEFALKVACDVLSFFTNFFGVPYPLSKCDQIAIPDFAMGAMENWGLITYREVLLLTSDKTTTYLKQSIASVIGHELAHQWFGNLVTMEWWSQLWLNEGFASFMDYVVTDHLFPEWSKWLEFTNDYRNEALTLDVLDSSHPVEVPVRNSAQIGEIFDTISYNKGSCVIQMVEGRLGDKFRTGLNHYIKKHSYKNTVTEDLWQSLSEHSGVDVRAWVDTFTKVTGYPVISFKQTSTPGVFELTQKKFRNGPEQTSDPLWNCYIKVQTESGSHEYVLDKKTGTFTVPNYNPQGWIKPNYGQTGYFRINYDPSIIKGLIPLIQSLKLPAVDRMGVLCDCFYLGKSRDIPITVFTDLLMAYTNEIEESIWQFIIARLGYLNKLVGDDKMSGVIVKLLKPLGERLGFAKKEGESSGDTNLRDSVLAALGVHGDPATVAKCRELFVAFKKDQSSLDPDIMRAVVQTVMKNGGEAEQTDIMAIYNASEISSQKETMLRVLACNNSPALTERALDFSLSKDVRSQDSYMVWYYISDSTSEAAWAYFVKNAKSIYETFKENPLIERMVSGMFSTRMSDERVQQVKQYFTENPIPLCERSLLQDFESIKDNNEFYNACKDDLLKWISSQ